jgi:aldose 1-epimerase
VDRPPTKLDTAFGLARDPDGRARVRLESPDGGRAVTVWLDEAHRYVMTFTGDDLPDPARRRRSLGVEPMTCPPNALQTGEDVRTLEPEEEFVSTWGITVE